MPRNTLSVAAHSHIDIAANISQDVEDDDLCELAGGDLGPCSVSLHQNAINQDPDIQAFSDAHDSGLKLQQLGLSTEPPTGSSKKSASAKGFASLGLDKNLLKAIKRRGYKLPTPIQRSAIPLIMDGQDVVAMARTGSGKTAAFVLPMIHRLKMHSPTFGSRALILSPSRELALQTLRVVKEFSRGTDLRAVLLVGGDKLDSQFESILNNPDIIVATPGRFLHLKVEMRLELLSIQYVVFDEADRLFEMGFAIQLTEIIKSLPSFRQTLLFSATLPSSLAEFSRANLQNQCLIRLDADTKISPDLHCTFFSLKENEKDAALLYILEHAIKMPTGPTPAARRLESPKAASDSSDSKKRKRDHANVQSPTEHSTIIFAATKHCVEFLSAFLGSYGFAVAHIYGALDQTARNIQVDRFRTGMINILVVTDIAARGIDIPVLANVINYNLPSQPKIFIHRVGRTARAGRSGWSYSLVREADIPYLVDLQTFLGRDFIEGQGGVDDQGRIKDVSFTENIVFGGFPPEALNPYCEHVERVLKEDHNMGLLKSVALKGEKLYLKSRNSASQESVRRSKNMIAAGKCFEINRIFDILDSRFSENGALPLEERKREEVLGLIRQFKPSETVFEQFDRGRAANPKIKDAVSAVRRIRQTIEQKRRRLESESRVADDAPDLDIPRPASHHEISTLPHEESEDDVEVKPFDSNTFNSVQSVREPWRDSKNYISYEPKGDETKNDKVFGVGSGGYKPNALVVSNFYSSAREATMDLTQDQAQGFAEASRPRPLLKRWDRKSKKYVNSDHNSKGSKVAMIRGESGMKLPATFRSGKFEEWKSSHRIHRVARLGESEKALPSVLRQATTARPGISPSVSGSMRFKHNSIKMPKQPDKFRNDYHKQVKRLGEAKESGIAAAAIGHRVKQEIKDAAAIRTRRIELQRKKGFGKRIGSGKKKIGAKKKRA